MGLHGGLCGPNDQKKFELRIVIPFDVQERRISEDRTLLPVF